MRPIDADALIEAHYEYCNKHHGEMDVFLAWSMRLMKNAPTIEPMPKYIDNDLVVGHYANGMVAMNERAYQRLQLGHTDIVRCKECKHNYNTAINHGKMNPRCDFTDYLLTENDFCSRGERREP